MSALANYYQAQADEKQASIPLINQQLVAARNTNVAFDADDAARRNAINAGAGLQGAEAGAINAKLPGQVAGQDLTNSQIVPDAAARRADQYAGATLAGIQAGAIGAKLPGDIASQAADTQSTLARTGFLGQTTANDLATSALERFQKSLLTPDQIAAGLARNAFPDGFDHRSKGGVVTKAIQDPKPNAKDTVPTMLQPGEAVLTKHAVDHYGPGVIAHMNAMGLMREKAHKELHTAFTKQLKQASQKKASRKAS